MVVPNEPGPERVYYMLLSDNALSGPIPTELGSLTRLAWLDLANNSLSGPVPESLMGLTDLVRMYLFGQTGCLTAANPTFATWLNTFDPVWNDGCPSP